MARRRKPEMTIERARRMVRAIEVAATGPKDAVSAGYAELLRMVDEHDGPRAGHQFHFSVACQGASSVVGDPDSYRDADWTGEPFTVTVRASSLSEACRQVSLLPLDAWTAPGEHDDEGDV